MAEDSALWQGSSTGHAASADVWAAPYTSTDFSDVLASMLNSLAGRGYVVPGFGNNLSVVENSPAAMSVLVNTGRALVNGRLYANTAQATVTIDTADATNPRLDRIVLRVDIANQTITLAALAGTPAATPALPSLTQSASTFEITLAYIWVAATTTTIVNTDIHDERDFVFNMESMISAQQQRQLLRNTEFLAGISARTYPPADWSLANTPSDIQTATKPSTMARGNYVQLTSNAASEGIQQTVAVLPSTVYAIRLLYNVTSGDVGSVVITDNGGTPATITRYLRRTGSDLEEFILYTTPADATTMTVQLLCLNNGDVVKYGQVLMMQGYHTGPFRPINPDESLVLLDEIELTADAATITFNVPSGFKNLRIVAAARHTLASANAYMALRFNGDTGNNYVATFLSYNGTTWSDTENYTNTSVDVAGIPASTAPANTRGAVIIDIQDYLEATLRHAVHGESGHIYATAAPGILLYNHNGKWSTAAAITSITIIGSAGNFVAGSRFSLYGIK